ncbi:Ubiquitin domain-containing protein UBFD1 [Plecturocebus cupreus]
MVVARVPDGMEKPGMDREAKIGDLGAGEAPQLHGDRSRSRASLQLALVQVPGDAVAQTSVSNSEDTGGSTGRELVDVKIIWNKKHDMKLPLDNTGSKLKQKIHWITRLLPAMQKVMHKGLIHEDKTLTEIQVTSGTKIMVVDSTVHDVLAIHTLKDAAQQDAKAKENKKEPLCRQTQHREVLDKGKSEDVMDAIC